MASAHIEVTGTASRTASKFRYFVDKLNQLRNEYGDLKDVLDQIALDNDWTSLAASLGVSESDAQSVYNVFGSMGSEINGAFISQLVSRCG
jgi:hypothetical protein